MKDFFKLKENNTTVSIEVLTGFTRNKWRAKGAENRAKTYLTFFIPL